MDFGTTLAVNEGSNAAFSAVLSDSAGNPIDSAAVSAITATLVDATSETTIRDAQSVLNTNGGTLGSAGAFSLTLSGDDVAAIGSRQYQIRRLTLEVTFDSGLLTSEHTFVVRNLYDYPGA